ncbi:MAG: argininosuccinate lyase [Clostridia bacterium]
MIKAMWEGRFQKPLKDQTNDFNSSIKIDWRMFKADIAGSIAHAKMLAATGIIDAVDAEKIVVGLDGILKDIESGTLEIDKDAEDIHMFVEGVLTDRIGDAGKRLHTARSRNDQVATDLRLYLKAEITTLKHCVLEMIDTLFEKAKLNTATIMPGYTHLQRAQPVLLSHYLLAYAEMFKRDFLRFADTEQRMNFCPLGAAALAGTTYPINRQMTAELLGFDAPSANSLDAVSDRDYVVELASAIAITMMHLSRFAEEVIFWCSAECKFLELDDGYATGSSIMPQKKNPDIAELVRGKCGRTYGNLMAVLTMMKGLPLAYNKDMQEDKEAIFDSVDTLKQCLPIFADMLKSATFLKDNMLKASEKGFINATDVADYLTKAGVPFRDAYKISGQLVALCIANNKTLGELSLDSYKQFSPLFGEDIFDAISMENCVNKRNSYGGAGISSQKKQLLDLELWLKEAKC